MASDRRVGLVWWTADAIADLTPERGFIISGGLGGAKTTGASILTVDRWLLNRNSDFTWIVAPTATRCEQIVLPALRQTLLDLYGLADGVHYRIYKGRFFKLVLKGYAHEIHILTGENAETLVGANVSFFWVTEPGLMTREVYEKLTARLRCPKAVVRQFVMEGTPEPKVGKSAWWADVGDIPGRGYDRLDEAKNLRRFIVETRMNRHLKPSPEVYVEKLRGVYGYDDAKFRAYTLGLFTDMGVSDRAYPGFVESRNLLLDDVDADPSVTLQLAFDFNVILAWVLSQRLFAQKSYYSPRLSCDVAIDESSGDARIGLMDSVAEFAAKFPVREFRHTLIEVDGDASGWARSHKVQGSDYERIEQYLRALGYERVEVVAPRQNPLVKHRLEMTEALMAYEQHVVSPRCRKLAEGYAKTALKPGTLAISKPPQDTWSHWPDAVGYYLYRANKDRDITNPDAKPVLGVG